MSSPPADDETLICDVAARDERAFARLVSRYTAIVRAIALRFTGNSADADEITQDAFLSVWNNAGHYDPARASFSTWLYRITANRCMDTLRRRRLWSWIGLDAAGDPAAPEPSAEESLGQRETLALVRQDILDLPERQRMALILVVTAERSAQDVAEILGVSRGAAEQLIVRARHALRDRQRERTTP